MTDAACSVMGIVNVTPDSFSDGGLFDTTESAIRRGVALWEHTRCRLDVGGESTRPGAVRVDVKVELARVLPVVSELSAAGVVVSIDTTRAVVARRAAAAGAVIVNDVSGGLADPGMGPMVADTGVRWVLNHSRGSSRDMYSAAVYTDVVSEVREELSMRVDDALDAGVDLSRLVLDPGLGFAKVGEQNWELLRNLDTFVGMGLPVLIGASRKRFLASVVRNGEQRPAAARDSATVAITVAAARAGVWGVRVHEVAPSVEAIGVVWKLDGSGPARNLVGPLDMRTSDER